MHRAISALVVLLVVIPAVLALDLRHRRAEREEVQTMTHAQVGRQFLFLEELNQQASLHENTKGKQWVAPEYKADSGGCTPLVDYEHTLDKVNKWWQWGKRLHDLGSKVRDSSNKADYMRALFHALGENEWIQLLDGWTHPKGKQSFGDWYIQDLLGAAEYAAQQFGQKRWLTVDVYTTIHKMAFTRDAVRLGKRNGYRAENSGVYLPVPDKPLGVFHDIHLNGALNYDPKLRRMEVSPYNGRGWKYNDGYLYRWVYPGVSEDQGKAIVGQYLKEAWDGLEATDQFDYDKRLDIVVKLYHNLENFHCFLDGNGRTNYVVLQAMLVEIGLHPVSLYNLMESALGSVEEERQRVIEGFFKWEEAYTTGASGWTVPAIEARGKDCEAAIGAIMGTSPAKDSQAIPDTVGGCTCESVETCKSNALYNGKKWCYTSKTKICTWTWDYCSPGKV